MKRKILVLTLLILVLGLPGLVRAESENGLFRQKLVQLRDERKAKVVENINSMLCTKNKNHTDGLLRQIERLTEILAKVETKAGVLKTEGKDVSSVTLAVTASKQSLETAKAAVQAQAAKPCSINISGSTKNLGAEVKSAIELLRKDLSSVREKVKLARVEVRKSVVALGKLMGEDL